MTREKVFVLMGTNADETNCLGVFKSKESLNEELAMYDDPTIYSKNPYYEYYVVEREVK